MSLAKYFNMIKKEKSLVRILIIAIFLMSDSDETTNKSENKTNLIKTKVILANKEIRINSNKFKLVLKLNQQT